ncbi:Small GTPase superfamily ARF/SAR type [Carpediemonas membranifera]|uniref:Small GTPase superfamily ARF/SAR type n=1 Tax=Carpediemonas membranifera TaxID=201153 RepID=A0A8J6B0R9_9EUKA|nr:Small GTPase superfamily ARF/SAR type [Carpediemonas membranifera]|eukprot:KAG9393108.1 Small GTPase superfamily ARF/SAR type [Carpediemonas membranifera]
MGLRSIVRRIKKKENELRILVIGLDGAGKSTIIRALKGGNLDDIPPTFGFTIDTLQYKHTDEAGSSHQFTLNFYDIGGQTTLRPFWRNYFEKTDGVIWVVDSTDADRLNVCRDSLHDILNAEKLSAASLLVMANKRDLDGALSVDSISNGLRLGNIEGRRWHIQPCSAVSGEGLTDGLDWLMSDVALAPVGAADLEREDDEMEAADVDAKAAEDAARELQARILGLAEGGDAYCAAVDELLEWMDAKCKDIFEQAEAYIDPRLPDLVGPLAAIAHAALLQGDDWPARAEHVLRLLFRFVGLRSPADVLRPFPHEVGLLHALLDACLNEGRNGAFETPDALAVALYWLGYVLEQPFGLGAMNVSPAAVTGLALRRLIATSTRVQRAAASVASSVMRRRTDVDPGVEVAFQSFWSDAVTALSTTFKDATDAEVEAVLGSFGVTTTAQLTLRGEALFCGLLTALCDILKRTDRDLLLTRVGTGLDVGLMETAVLEHHAVSSGRMTALFMRFVSRVGTIFAEDRVPRWQYRVTADATGPDDDSIPFDVPPQFDFCFDALLEGLKNPSSIARWAAAKGLSVLTRRLCRDFACDVVTAVLALVRDSDPTPYSTHGACLCLGELARHGLLVGQDITEVVTKVVGVLRHTDRAVRDAACYVCWALPRCYVPSEFAETVQLMSSALLCVSCFDQEASCRRAACSAFHELVGRLGHRDDVATVAHGLSLLTVVQYFSVGLMHVSFTEVAPRVAEFSEAYRSALLRWLIAQCALTSDSKTGRTRTLAAEAIPLLSGGGGVAILESAGLEQMVNAALVPRTELESWPYLRAGALSALASFVGVCGPSFSYGGAALTALPATLLDGGLVDLKADPEELLSSLAVYCTALAKTGYADETTSTVARALLRSTSLELQDTAVVLLDSWKSPAAEDMPAWLQTAIESLNGVAEGRADVITQRHTIRGMGLALPRLVRILGRDPLDKAVIDAVTGAGNHLTLKAGVVAPIEVTDACLHAATSLLIASGAIPDIDVTPRPKPAASAPDRLLATVLAGTANYTLERVRGDVGAMVRAAACQALADLAEALPLTADAKALFIDRGGCALLRLATERLVPVRDAAIAALKRLCAMPSIGPCMAFVQPCMASFDDNVAALVDKGLPTVTASNCWDWKPFKDPANAKLYAVAGLLCWKTLPDAVGSALIRGLSSTLASGDPDHILDRLYLFSTIEWDEYPGLETPETRPPHMILPDDDEDRINDFDLTIRLLGNLRDYFKPTAGKNARVEDAVLGTVRLLATHELDVVLSIAEEDEVAEVEAIMGEIAVLAATIVSRLCARDNPSSNMVTRIRKAGELLRDAFRTVPADSKATVLTAIISDALVQPAIPVIRRHAAQWLRSMVPPAEVTQFKLGDAAIWQEDGMQAIEAGVGPTVMEQRHELATGLAQALGLARMPELRENVAAPRVLSAQDEINAEFAAFQRQHDTMRA